MAGRKYELVEERPPAGYGSCRNIAFSVPLRPEAITIRMKDKKTEVVVEKLTLSSAENASPSEADKQKPGFILQILNKDKSPAKAVRDYSGFKEGEELITSHISSKYLEGIKIGTVSSISTDSSNLTQSAKVTPFVDFQHLEDVLVITQLKEVPADSESAD